MTFREILSHNQRKQKLRFMIVRMFILAGVISLALSCGTEAEATVEQPTATQVKETSQSAAVESSPKAQVTNLKKPGPKPRSKEELEAVATKAKVNSEVKENVEKVKTVVKSEPVAKKKEVIEEAPKAVKEVVEKKKSTPKSSIIKFEETTHSFGTAKEGELISHKFFFENVGKRDLLIKDATATCGCTVPSYPKVPVRPGELSYIRVSFNTKAKTGHQAPVVTIYTNARKAPYKLKLEGVVEKADTTEETETTSEG